MFPSARSVDLYSSCNVLDSMTTQIERESSDSSEPKGILVAVGGNEDKKQDLSILRTIISLVGKEMVRIEVITTASETPSATGEQYARAFKRIGGNEFNLLHIDSREEGNDEAFISRIREADVIFFTGGDQLRITSILGGTRLLKELKSRYFNDTVIIAGTSAGASAMSETMIYGGGVKDAILKGTVQVTAGIGLINNIIIDSHFIKRGRFSRLLQIVCTNPGHLGLGLGEDSGIVIEKGHVLKAIGKGLVVIFEGQHIRYSNIASINNGEAIAVENIHIHTLVGGHGYDLADRKYLKPEDMEHYELKYK